MAKIEIAQGLSVSKPVFVVILVAVGIGGWLFYKALTAKPAMG